jgi:hypothetical protein
MPPEHNLQCLFLGFVSMSEAVLYDLLTIWNKMTISKFSIGRSWGKEVMRGGVSSLLILFDLKGN